MDNNGDTWPAGHTQLPANTTSPQHLPPPSWGLTPHAYYTLLKSASWEPSTTEIETLKRNTRSAMFSKATNVKIWLGAAAIFTTYVTLGVAEELGHLDVPITVLYSLAVPGMLAFIVMGMIPLYGAFNSLGDSLHYENYYNPTPGGKTWIKKKQSEALTARRKLAQLDLNAGPILPASLLTKDEQKHFAIDGPTSYAQLYDVRTNRYDALSAIGAVPLADVPYHVASARYGTNKGSLRKTLVQGESAATRWQKILTQYEEVHHAYEDFNSDTLNQLNYTQFANTNNPKVQAFKTTYLHVQQGLGVLEYDFTTYRPPVDADAFGQLEQDAATMSRLWKELTESTTRARVKNTLKKLSL